jgi:hypothetical protein
MDIDNLSIQELKALAYDQVVLLQQTQNNIQLLENKIKLLEKENGNNEPKSDSAK